MSLEVTPYRVIELEKAATRGHKYVEKKPTGNPKNPFLYIYPEDLKKPLKEPKQIGGKVTEALNSGDKKFHRLTTSDQNDLVIEYEGFIRTQAESFAAKFNVPRDQIDALRNVGRLAVWERAVNWADEKVSTRKELGQQLLDAINEAIKTEVRGKELIAAKGKPGLHAAAQKKISKVENKLKEEIGRVPRDEEIAETWRPTYAEIMPKRDYEKRGVKGADKVPLESTVNPKTKKTLIGATEFVRRWRSKQAPTRVTATKTAEGEVDPLLFLPAKEIGVREKIDRRKMASNLKKMVERLEQPDRYIMQQTYGLTGRPPKVVDEIITTLKEGTAPKEVIVAFTGTKGATKGKLKTRDNLINIISRVRTSSLKKMRQMPEAKWLEAFHEEYKSDLGVNLRKSHESSFNITDYVVIPWNTAVTDFA